jgi:3-hydroxyisobutyrate dehydrogenase
MDIGWIGIGRMGYAMAERLLKAGQPLKVWNRTRAKADPLGKLGAAVVGRSSELRGVDVLFTMVSTGKDLREVCFGADGVIGDAKSNLPGIVVDCSSIGADESKNIRADLAARGIQFLAAPVSGNAKCVKVGKLSQVVSGPRAAFDRVRPLLEILSPRGVSYVGDGELARICKIAHNVMLGVVITNLVEITLLAQKAGVPRHAFLDFINNSVMGSLFTRYKSPALVNCDWTTTFTPELLKKDLDLGLDAAHKLAVPVPVTAAAREVLQAHIAAARLKPDPDAYLALDFAALLETVALTAGIKVESENVPVASGLEG